MKQEMVLRSSPLGDLESAIRSLIAGRSLVIVDSRMVS